MMPSWVRRVPLAFAAFIVVGTLVTPLAPQCAVWCALVAAGIVWHVRRPPPAVVAASAECECDEPIAECTDTSTNDDWQTCPTIPMPVAVPDPLTSEQLGRLVDDRSVRRWSIDEHTGLPVLWDGDRRVPLDELIAERIEPHLERAYVEGMQYAMNLSGGDQQPATETTKER